MKPGIVRKYWTQLLIAFDEGYTLDGFKKTEKNFQLPENLIRFEARLKRELTICNLFSNQQQSISSIARVLDMNYGQVVTILIDHGFIKERRRTVKKLEEARILVPSFSESEVGFQRSKEMKPRIVRKYWTQLLIAFDQGYTLDGFKKTEKNFQLPENLIRFEARLKRDVTICNLFSNQQQSISSIARVLDMNYGQVVTTLIDHGFIKERRRTVKKPEMESSPQVLSSEAREPKTQELNEAVTAVDSEQTLLRPIPSREEKKPQFMSGILDVKWTEPQELEGVAF